jgi:hypothetical protein
MIFGMADCCRDHSCVRWNMIARIVAARTIPALGGMLYDLQKVVARIIPALGGILAVGQ